ncbi:MAG: hypothetical protein HY318_09005 [Armatimonadetes bacterium]|nr:hypothetical protein [Armatimonadota bacterium]
MELLQSTLQPRWLPDDGGSQQRIYLGGRRGFLSVLESAFCVAYEKEACDIAISGPVGELVILIKPQPTALPPLVSAELSQARARTAGNVLDVYIPERKPGPAQEEVSQYLRSLANSYLRSEILTGVRPAAFLPCWLNGGLYTGWGADAFHDPVQSPRPVTRTVNMWTNGRIVRFYIQDEYHEYPALHPLYADLLPVPLEAKAMPLNPEIVRYFDLLYPATSEGWPCSDGEATHRWVRLKIRWRSLRSDSEQVWVPLPLTEARWHLAEWAVLTNAALETGSLHAYNQGLRSADDIAQHAKLYRECWEEFQHLKYPAEVELEHQKVLAALGDNERAWRVVEGIWQTASQPQSPTQRENLVTTVAGALQEKGLADVSPTLFQLGQYFHQQSIGPGQLEAKHGMRLGSHIGPLAQGFGKGT